MRKPRNDVEQFPVDAPTCPIILILKDEVFYACSVEDKQELHLKYLTAKKAKEKPRLLGVWPGNYRSDVFNITQEKLEEL